jgi:hypothetical protein
MKKRMHRSARKMKQKSDLGCFIIRRKKRRHVAMFSQRLYEQNLASELYAYGDHHDRRRHDHQIERD